MKHSLLGLQKGSLAFLFFALLCLDFGCKGGKIPGSGLGETPLDPIIRSNNPTDRRGRNGPIGSYSPHFQTGDMTTPRYLHEAIRLKNGLILITGGTDERGFSAFETGEIYNPFTKKSGEPEPPSGTGVWFDTDFEGNPIAMEYRRLWHTMTTLPDNRVIVIGGAPNFLKGQPHEKVEVFDPEKRIFETLKDAKMIVPRARHTANFLQDGTILITGGQFHNVFTDIQTAGSGLGTGTITLQTQYDLYPSTDTVEVFNFRDLLFSELTRPDSTIVSRLTSRRGRAGHASAPFAGPDNKLDTGDDLFMIVGGFQTSTTPQLIPDFLFPRFILEQTLENIEVYDPALHLFVQIGTVNMRASRVNDPEITTLGIFNDRTPDEILGMGNVILVTNGDDNADCWGNWYPQCVDDFFCATFSGVGPLKGLVLTPINYSPQGEIWEDDGHIQNSEYNTAALLQGVYPEPPFPTANYPVPYAGRSTSNIVPLPRTVEARPGILATSTWIFAGGGAHYHCTPAGTVQYTGGTIASGAIFDPLYALIPQTVYDLDPSTNARDLKRNRRPDNPTGVLGCWLGMDGKLPSSNRVGFGDTDVQSWAVAKSVRTYPQLIATPGEDGIINTTDDRVLLTGGGQDGVAWGGEPSAPSCELVLIPPSPP